MGERDFSNEGKNAIITESPVDNGLGECNDIFMESHNLQQKSQCKM